MSVAFDRDEANDCQPAQNNKGNDGKDLDGREPELAFREDADGEVVGQEDQDHEDQAPDPDRDAGKPVAHDDP